MVDEITINDLLIKFNVKLSLPIKLLKYNISSDFLNSIFKKRKSDYVFAVDDVELIINPNNRNETVKYNIIVDNNVKGVFILGYNSMKYLN